MSTILLLGLMGLLYLVLRRNGLTISTAYTHGRMSVFSRRLMRDILTLSGSITLLRLTGGLNPAPMRGNLLIDLRGVVFMVRLTIQHIVAGVSRGS